MGEEKVCDGGLLVADGDMKGGPALAVLGIDGSSALYQPLYHLLLAHSTGQVQGAQPVSVTQGALLANHVRRIER